MRKFTIVLIVILLVGCASQKVKMPNRLDEKAIFILYLKNPSFNDVTIYKLHIVKIGNETKIYFLNYTYHTTSKWLALVHERMKSALKDAWLLRKGNVYYLYTPKLKYMKGKVCEYPAMNGIPSFEFLPIVTNIDLARYVRGERFTLSYPAIRFAKSCNVVADIEKGMLRNFTITARFENTSIEMKFIVLSLKTSDVKCNMSLKGLYVIKRYPSTYLFQARSFRS